MGSRYPAVGTVARDVERGLAGVAWTLRRLMVGLSETTCLGARCSKHTTGPAGTLPLGDFSSLRNKTGFRLQASMAKTAYTARALSWAAIHGGEITDYL